MVGIRHQVFAEGFDVSKAMHNACRASGNYWCCRINLNIGGAKLTQENQSWANLLQNLHMMGAPASATCHLSAAYRKSQILSAETSLSYIADFPYLSWIETVRTICREFGRSPGANSVKMLCYSYHKLEVGLLELWEPILACETIRSIIVKLTKLSSCTWCQCSTLP